MENIISFMLSMDWVNGGVNCTPKKKWKNRGGIFICTFTQNTRMFEVSFFPLYGLMIGFNYWNENMNLEENEHKDVQHIIQIMVLIFGFSVTWYEPKQED